MEMPGWVSRLQKRWGVNSGWQVLVILLVFALTGTSSLYVKKWIYALIGFEPEQWWEKALGIIFVVLPAYQVLLLVYGTLLGQFTFFWNFEKRMFSFLWRKKKED